MPILKKEPSQTPDNLFDEQFLEQGYAAGSAWLAVYTMSNKEKEFMRRLVPSGVPFYCPIISKTYRSPQGRKRTSHVPLFSNYVFIFATSDQRTLALKTNCVSKCLDVVDQSRFASDLSQLALMINSNAPLTPENQLVPGEMVRVKSGPFAGATGVVFQRRTQSRFLVQVDFLQAGASVEIQDWDLEKLAS